MNKITNKWLIFNQFITFLEGECSIIELSKSDDKVITLKLQICSNFPTVAVSSKYYACKEQHKIFKCPQFLQMYCKEKLDIVKTK